MRSFSVSMFMFEYVCVLVVCVWKAAGQRARCRPVCLCKYVRLSDEVTAEDASCSLMQWCMCGYKTAYFTFCMAVWSWGALCAGRRMSGCVSLAKSCRDFNQARQTYSTRTRSLSLCLGYFISARHHWCPGPTQGARSRVKPFTHDHCTSILKIGLFFFFFSFLQQLCLLLEVIWEEGAAFDLKPAEWKWVWLDNDTREIRQSQKGGGALV